MQAQLTVRHLLFIAKILTIPTQRKYLYRWLNSLQTGYFLKESSPWLVFDSIEWLKEYIQCDMRVFEYGSGGSTMFWLNSGTQCVSIEHDSNWYRLVSSRLKKSSSLDYRLIEPEGINQLVNEINPADPDLYQTDFPGLRGQIFRNYVTQIDPFPDQYFDIIIIDGRARPSCIKHAASKVKRGGIMILDNAEREHYLRLANKYLIANYSLRSFKGIGPQSPSLWQTNIYQRLQ